MSKLPSFVAPVKNNLDLSNSQSSSALPISLHETNERDNKKTFVENMQTSVNFSAEMESNISVVKKTLENDKRKPNKRQAKSKDISQKKIKKDKKVAENNTVTLEKKLTEIKTKEKKSSNKGKKMKSISKKGNNEKLIEKPKAKNNLKSNRIEENKPKEVNFEGSLETTSQQMSQTSNSASRKIKLSQPPKLMSFKDKLKWLQERRQVGIWVECCHTYCKKFRYIPDVHDPLQLPAIWYCNMNADAEANSCSKAEHKLNVAEEEDLIHGLYSAGSLVWAQLESFPWWPAMVDDCADTEQFYWLDGFSDIPNYYNVTFFDAGKVTRAWIKPNKLRPYFASGKVVQYQQQKVPVNFQRGINMAIQQANDASKLPVLERLQKYSFIARYKGPINSPIKSDRSERYLSKYHNLSSRSSDSSSSDSEDSSQSEERAETVIRRKPIADTVDEKRNKPLANRGKKPTVGKGLTRKNSIDSQMTIIEESEVVAWKDKAVSILREKSLSGMSKESEEIPIQSQIIYKKSLKKVLSQDSESNYDKSLSREDILTHSQSCVDVTDVATENITEPQDSELIETEESIFRNLLASDAMVPSTETDVAELHLELSDMSDESDKTSNKSLNFDMY